MAKKNVELNFVFDKAIEELQRVDAALKASGQKSLSHAKTLAQLAKVLDDSVSSYQGNKEAAQAYADKIKSLAGSANTLKRKLDLLTQGQETLNKAQERGTNVLESFDRLTKKAEKADLARKAELQAAAQERLTIALNETIAAQKRLNDLDKLRGDAPTFPNAGLDPEQSAAADFGRRRKEAEGLAKAIREIEEQGEREAEKQAEALAKREQAGLRARVKQEEEAISAVQKAREKSQEDAIKLQEQKNKRAANAQQQLEDAATAFDKQTKALAEKDNKDQKKLYGQAVSTFEKSEDEKTEAIKKEISERLKLIKEYLDHEEGLQSGRINQKQAANITPSKKINIARGQSELSNLQKGNLTPEVFTSLSASVDRYKKDLAATTVSQNKFAASSKTTNEAVKEFTLSWESMGRIITARAITQVFFEFQNGIRSSVNDARELYNAVAEIQTITDSTTRSVLDFRTSLQRVTDLSGKINFTPIDVANAIYETLSNQIGGTTSEIVNFIEVAGNLGKVTRSTLADSADAIAAVVNAYNLSISDAQDVSEKFFVLVDQGRLKLEEVANHIGNVAVPASQLGVGFDQVVAALSAISIAGVPAREAMTLQRNVMFKLIDPTEEMVDLFNEWGVASGQAAVATFGFEKVIQLLGVEAEKGNERIADLFGTIRAVRGILGLTDENFKKYTTALKAVNDSHEEYIKIVEEFLSNPGEKFNKLLQQTKNEILEVGLALVELISDLADFFGETEEGNYRLAEFIGFMGKAGIVLGVGATSFVVLASATSLFGASASKATIETLALSAAVTGLSGANTAAAASGTLASKTLGTVFSAVKSHKLAAAIAAIVALGAAYIITSDSAEESLAKMKAASEEANKDIGKAFQEGIIKSLKETEDRFQKFSKNTLNVIAETVRNLNDKIKELEKLTTVEKLTEDFERLQAAISGDEAAQKFFAALDEGSRLQKEYQVNLSATTKSIEDQNSSFKREADQIQSVIDKLLGLRDASLEVIKSNRLSTAQSIAERTISGIQNPNQKAQAQFGLAQNISRQAANTGDIEESRELFKIAQKFLQEAERTAFESGAFGTLDKHIAFFNQQEAALSAAQEQREQQEIAIINQQGQQLENQHSQLENQYEINNAELERRRILEERINLEKSFLDYYVSKSKEIAKDDRLNEQEKLEAQRKLYEQVRPNLQSPQSIAAIENQQNINALEIRKQEQLDQAQEVTRNAELQAQASQELAKANDELAGKVRQLATDYDFAIELISKSIKNNAEQVGKDRSFKFNTQDDIDTYAAKQKALADQQRQLQEIKSEVDQLKSTPVTNAQESAVFVQRLSELFSRLEQIATETSISPETREAINNLKTQLIAIPQLQQSITEQQQAYINSLNSSVERQTDIILEANRLNNLLSTFIEQFPGQISRIITQPSNYVQRFAAGGPVGTDTVPAWLTPGEFVVNRSAARKNAGLLNMINEGRVRRFAEGGSVSNTTQSFTNTFNLSSASPQMQVNTLISAMKRQISQGKATLSKGRPY